MDIWPHSDQTPPPSGVSCPRVNYSVNVETIIHVFLFVISVFLNVKPLKQCMYFWVPSIAFPKLELLYINYTINIFVPAVQKKILDIMLPVRTSLLHKSILVEYLVYFSSLNPCFASLFSQAPCNIFEPKSSLCESILVESLVYFAYLYPCFASIF